MARVKQPSIEEPFGSKGPTAKEEALAREREERFSKLSAWKVRKLIDCVWLLLNGVHYCGDYRFQYLFACGLCFQMGTLCLLPFMYRLSRS